MAIVRLLFQRGGVRLTFHGELEGQKPITRILGSIVERQSNSHLFLQRNITDPTRERAVFCSGDSILDLGCRVISSFYARGQLLELLPKLEQFGVDNFLWGCLASSDGAGAVEGGSLSRGLMVWSHLEKLLSGGGRSELILERLLHGMEFADLCGETLGELFHGFGDCYVQVDRSDWSCGVGCSWGAAFFRLYGGLRGLALHGYHRTTVVLFPSVLSFD